MKIILVGNMEPLFSSESHYKWTLEHMGHIVIPFQENRTNANEILDACKKSDCLFWVHTHSWSFPGENEITPESIKIPSFSYHLDRYFGIGSREKDYLKHPSFHLDYFFSTDGGNEDGWKAAGINHVYLPAGVVEYGAYMGTPKEPKIDILFAGSTQYHAEYPFRPRMVAALGYKYGNRFQVRTGVRESPLNDLYASAKICVGDHIFAGCPLYASDRLFETVGRGGFIIYPDTPGVTDLIPGLLTYQPQNIEDLISKIDYYLLEPQHDFERRHRMLLSFDWVRKNATYTQRLEKILEIVL